MTEREKAQALHRLIVEAATTSQPMTMLVNVDSPPENVCSARPAALA